MRDWSCTDLELLEVPAVRICSNIFAHNCCYSAESPFRDVPEFQPGISLDGMRRVFDSMREDNRIPPSQPEGWEDRIMERVECR